MPRSTWSKPEHLAQVIEANGAPAGSQFIVELIEAGLKAQNEARDEERAEQKKDQKPNTYFTDAGKCERAIFFRLTGEEVTNPLTADSLMNFKIGHAVEDAVGEVLSWATGGQILREVSTEFEVNGHRISGRADFLITVPESRVLIELKKTSSRALGWMVKNGQPGRDEHRKQANLYVHASQLGKMWIPHEYGPDGICLGCGVLRRGGVGPIPGETVDSEHRTSGAGDARGSSTVPEGGGDGADRRTIPGDSGGQEAGVVLPGESARAGRSHLRNAGSVSQSDQESSVRGGSQQPVQEAASLPEGTSLHGGEHRPDSARTSRVSNLPEGADALVPPTPESCYPFIADIAYLVYVPADATKGEPIANAFPVAYNPLVAKGDLEFLAQMSTLADNGEDPGIPIRIEAMSKKGKAPNFPCGYCSYESRCWG